MLWTPGPLPWSDTKLGATSDDAGLLRKIFRSSALLRRISLSPHSPLPVDRRAGSSASELRPKGCSEHMSVSTLAATSSADDSDGPKAVADDAAADDPSVMIGSWLASVCLFRMLFCRLQVTSSFLPPLELR